MDYSHLLSTILKKLEPELRNISEVAAKHTKNPEKWSKIQILGHLIDSGINNIARFIRAQKTDHLTFEGYEQVFWAEAMGYRDAEWQEILTFFISLNRQIARVISNIPVLELVRPRPSHSLTWPLYASKEATAPVTLEFLIADYVAHLEHHLLQIVPDYEAVLYRKGK